MRSSRLRVLLFFFPAAVLAAAVTMLSVLRLQHHADAIAAARAFDRATLCLAQAHMCSKAPELNFPVEDYDGERLPDLRGAGCAALYCL
jgi:hypothetical protein